jgi:hypothetical protein
VDTKCSAVRIPILNRSPKIVSICRGMFATNINSRTNRNCSGNSCPILSTAMFYKYDNCFASSQAYCCRKNLQLQGCHWTGGSSGLDCANAVCNATEVEVDRAQFGGSSLGACSCKFTPVECSGQRPNTLRGERESGLLHCRQIASGTAQLRYRFMPKVSRILSQR